MMLMVMVIVITIMLLMIMSNDSGDVIVRYDNGMMMVMGMDHDD